MTDKTKAVTLTKIEVANLPLGTTQFVFNDKVDKGFDKIETAIDQAIVDLTGHKTAIDEVSVVADGAAAKAQQGVDNAATAQTQADKGVRDAATAQAKAEQVETDYKAADTAITAAYTQADTTLKSTIETAYKAADKTLTDNLATEKGRIDAVVKDNSEVLTYSNSTATLKSLGGIEVGKTFDKVPIAAMLDKLLYPYVAPTVSSISSVEAPKLREEGTSVTVSKVSGTVTKGSRAITKIELFRNGVTTNKSIAGDNTSYSFDNLGDTFTTGEVKYTVKVSDTEKAVAAEASTGKHTFAYPYFHGVLASQDKPSAESIKVGRVLETKGTKTYSYTMAKQCAFIAYPAAHGDLKKALDRNGFDNINSFVKHVVPITGQDGKAINYNVYIKEKATATDFNLTFSY